MNLGYHLGESLHSLTTNPLRSSLSIVGVVFGVASVVAMLSIGLGAEAEIERLLSALGAQNVHVTAKEMDDDAWNRVIKATTGLGPRDRQLVHDLHAEVPVTEVAEWRSTDVNRPLSGPRLTIYGMTPNYRAVLGAEVVSGRSFSDWENELGRPVALIGETLAREWFGDAVEQAVGKLVRIDRIWFHVVGVLEGEGPMPGRGGDALTNDDKPEGDAKASKPGDGAAPELRLLGLSDAVILPLGTARKRLGPIGTLAPLERLVLKLPPDVDPIAARKRIEAHAARLHRGADVVTVTAADEVIEQKRSTTRLFSYFLLTIALISLVVGGIGIANVMLASMVERIREVGLRRAIGAKKRHILWQFLTEALAICLIGGLIGGVAGMGVGWAIGLITGWNVVFPWWGLVVALLIATLVGTIAGLYPALTAARISPIEALQGRA